MCRPSSDPLPLWESPVPLQDQKKHWGWGSEWGMMEHYNLVDSGLLWVPDSSYQPAAALLTGCVQRGRVREELRWAFEEGGLFLNSDTHHNKSSTHLAAASEIQLKIVSSLSGGEMQDPRGDRSVLLHWLCSAAALIDFKHSQTMTPFPNISI